MANDRKELAMESLQIDFNSTNAVEENFTNVITSVYVSTNADCYLAFNTSANADDFLLSPDDGVVQIQPASFTRLSVLGASGSGTLYVIACRI